MPKMTDEQYIMKAKESAKTWADKMFPMSLQGPAYDKLREMIEQLFMMAWGEGRLAAWDQAKQAVDETRADQIK